MGCWGCTQMSYLMKHLGGLQGIVAGSPLLSLRHCSLGEAELRALWGALRVLCLGQCMALGASSLLWGEGTLGQSTLRCHREWLVKWD